MAALSTKRPTGASFELVVPLSAKYDTSRSWQRVSGDRRRDDPGMGMSRSIRKLTIASPRSYYQRTLRRSVSLLGLGATTTAVARAPWQFPILLPRRLA